MPDTLTKLMQKPPASGAQPVDARRKLTTAEIAWLQRAAEAMRTGRVYTVTLGIDRAGNLRAKEETHFTPIT